MKYNPRINEELARLEEFYTFPYQPQGDYTGALQLMFELQQFLAEIGGVDKVTLRPAAGARVS